MGSAPRALLPTPNRGGGGGRRNASCQASFSRRLTFTAVGSLALDFDLAMANLRGARRRLSSRPRMSCPNCGGFLIREPASVRCVVACGCRWEILDADDDARLRQRLIDRERQPRSAECWPEFQDVEAPPPRPGRGWVTLPGPGAADRRAASRRVGGGGISGAKRRRSGSAQADQQVQRSPEGAPA